MSVYGKHNSVTIVAGVDLRAQQYKIITIAGTICQEADTAAGVLMSKPDNGQHASIAVDGNMKAYAAASIAAGARITCAVSGYLVTVGSGDGAGVGKALEAANSGDLFNFLGDFATANTTYNQL